MVFSRTTARRNFARTGLPLTITSAQPASDHLRRHKTSADTPELIRKILSAPILLNVKVIGVIEISHKGETAESVGPDLLRGISATLLTLLQATPGSSLRRSVAPQKSRCNRRSPPRKPRERGHRNGLTLENLLVTFALP
jgi:hypothetical protein